MKTLTSKEFWSATAGRAIRSAAQGAITMVGITAVGMHEVDWLIVASGAGLMAILSILTSIAMPPVEVKLEQHMHELEYELGEKQGNMDDLINVDTRAVAKAVEIKEVELTPEMEEELINHRGDDDPEVGD